ncbi:MAG TPA: hypothetical protein VL360_00360 [Gammaproteobacteria bacterium]|jgi:hypothetical protein|nr:hypothetical protein [Gammaproteobacteria bacterium]
MISRTRRNFDDNDVIKLLSNQQYDAIVHGLNERSISENTFKNALDKTFGNDLSNPDLAKCLIALFSNKKISEANIRIVSRSLYNRLVRSDANHDGAVELLADLLERSSKNEVGLYGLCGMLARPKMDKYAVDLINQHDKSSQNYILSNLLPHVIYKCNASLLHTLVKEFNLDIEKSIGSDSNDEGHILLEQARLLLNLDYKYHDEIAITMAQFVEEFGDITFEGGLLTCAQIRENKKEKYEFNPIILPPHGIEDKVSEYCGEYIDILKDISIPACERFIIPGDHWFVGEIEIDQNKNINAYILDSLSGGIVFSEDFADELRKRFPDSNINIYYADEVRQNSKLGCSVFSLDDIRQLFTLNKYVGSKYSTQGLYGYLADNQIDSKEGSDENIHLHRCQTPLKLLRSMQSFTLKKEVIPSRSEEEQNLAISGKGETAKQSVKKYFVDNNNQRVWQKLTVNIAQKNAMYLLSHDPEVIQAHKEDFTLAAFRRRVEEMKSEAKERPPFRK